MTTSSDETELSGDLGLFSVFTTAAGTMIGAGIFILPSVAIGTAGPAAALSFLIAGVIALGATLCAIELATAMPRAGGSYFYVSRAMGPAAGTVVGLGSWISLIFKGSFALVGLGQYISYFSPVPVIGVAVVGGLALTLLNWIGAKESGKLQNAVVIGLLIIMGVFSAQGLLSIDWQLLTPFNEYGWQAIIEATGLVFISYLGIVKATAITEEVKDPGETMPKALISAVVFVTILYAVVMLIITGVLPLEDIIASDAAFADAGEILFGNIGGLIIAFAGILATISTGNAAILSSSRYPFAMARDGVMFESLKDKSDRFGTPSRSIWFTGIAMVGLALAFDVEGLAKIGGTFGILVFVLLNLTVVLLRRANPDWYEPSFRAPFVPIMPVLGAIAALALIPFMGLQSQLAAGLFIIFGACWYLLQRRIGEEISPQYSFRDQLQRVKYQDSLRQETVEEASERPSILIEIEPGQANKDLLTIATAVAKRLDADLRVLVISEAPFQFALSHYDPDIDEDWWQKLETRLEDRTIETSLDHIITHDRTQALLDQVNETTELLLIDWHDPIRERHLRESHVDEILRSNTPIRVGVLKHRGAGDRETITVATEQGPYDRAEVELADAIAANTGADLDLVKIMPEDSTDEQQTNATDYLKELATSIETEAETNLILDDDIEGRLIELGDQSDLLIMGAPSRPDHLHDFFGQTTDIVAATTESSVLVAKEPAIHLPWYERLIRWLTHR